jgi:hypothetical protein
MAVVVERHGLGEFAKVLPPGLVAARDSAASAGTGTSTTTGTVYGTGTAVLRPEEQRYRALRARAVAVREEIAAIMASGEASPAVAGCDGLSTQLFAGGCSPDLVTTKIFLVAKYNQARSALRQLSILPSEVTAREAYVQAVGDWVLAAYEAAALRRVWSIPAGAVSAPGLRATKPLVMQGVAGTSDHRVNVPTTSVPTPLGAFACTTTQCRAAYAEAIWAMPPWAGGLLTFAGSPTGWNDWARIFLLNEAAPIPVFAGPARTRITLPSGKTMVVHAQSWARYVGGLDLWMLLQENVVAYLAYLKPYADHGVIGLTPAQIVAAQNEAARKPLSVLNAGGTVLGMTGPVGTVVGAIIQVVAAVLPMAVGGYSCPIPMFTRSLSDPACDTTTAAGAAAAAEAAARVVETVTPRAPPSDAPPDGDSFLKNPATLVAAGVAVLGGGLLWRHRRRALVGVVKRARKDLNRWP